MDSSDDGFRDLLDYAGCSVYSITKLEQKDVIVHDFLQYSLVDKLEKPIQQYVIVYSILIVCLSTYLQLVLWYAATRHYMYLYFHCCL